MSSEERQERPRRRMTPRRAFPETDALIDDYAEISTLAPEEIRRYSGMR
jgi:hypothetical protein